MNSPLPFRIIYSLVLFLIIQACSNEKKIVITISPDSSYEHTLKISEDNSKLIYSLNYDMQEVISESGLGFKFSDTMTTGKISIDQIITKSADATWKPIYGEKSEYPDVFNETLVTFRGLNYAIRVRAYNEGVAFRYESENNQSKITISSEETEFEVPSDASAWVSSRAQSEITKVQVSEIEEAKERPMLLQYSDSLFVAIGEAGLVDYARMKLTNKRPGSGNLSSSLSGVVTYDRPFNTPWRFIMAAKQPGEILENNYLILNLSEGNEIDDTSWIQPGKVIREVTLTTTGGLACVDFAAQHNLQFVEFDAGWYGNEYDDASDATTITVDPKRSPGPLDLNRVIDYAKERGIKILLYVNRRALEKQLDEVLPLLKSWGVAGIKYGFVNVGPQEWTDWLHEAIRKAANHELMVDVHDEYRPTGYSRTYPNFMTQEGIRGDEESPSNEMAINTIFTRMIAGAGDHTNCYFAGRVSEKMGSHASQMAKTICIYSPWQFVYWYDRPQGSPVKKGGAGGSVPVISEIPDLSFYDAVPTVWDDTKVLGGYPGEYAVIARRNGNDWYLGALTDIKSYNLALTLDFLDKNTKYLATIYSHDDSLNTQTKVKIEEIEVTNKSTFNREIPKQNGLAVIFKPQNR
ncbi:MAG: glycoside hydrolase family 97 N-terminal domain-containing protein [Cyclobacteriaceae bacterium]